MKEERKKKQKRKKKEKMKKERKIEKKRKNKKDKKKEKKNQKQKHERRKNKETNEMSVQKLAVHGGLSKSWPCTDVVPQVGRARMAVQNLAVHERKKEEIEKRRKRNKEQIKRKKN